MDVGNAVVSGDLHSESQAMKDYNQAIIKAALSYVQERGWFVLPLVGLNPDGTCACGSLSCDKPGKHPLAGSHGYLDATRDPDEIRKWAEIGHPINLGIAVGPNSELAVVDVDGAGGETILRRSGDELPESLMVITGNGRHVYFRHPGVSVGRKIRLLQCEDSKDGVDLLSEKGYVVAPPSKHASGKTYEWVDSECEMADLPQWLIERAKAKESAKAEPRVSDVGSTQSIPEGQRNTFLTMHAGIVRRYGSDERTTRTYLEAINLQHCDQPLGAREIDSIVRSAMANFEPSPGAIADLRQTRDPPRIVSALELIKKYTDYRQPVVHGLLRRGETMNIIAAPKTGKSWMAMQLAAAIVTGGKWLDQWQCEQGKVLLIDNELHEDTIAKRILAVAMDMGLDPEFVAASIDVLPVRGSLEDLNRIRERIKVDVASGAYQLIIIDSWYKALPKGVDENSNSDITGLYVLLDECAEHANCCFVVIHHSSKGNQSTKSVTDRGAGAGSQSRAVDTHLTIIPHEMPGLSVVDAVTRTWPAPASFCIEKLNSDSQLWKANLIADPRRQAGPEKGAKPTRPEPTPEEFVEQFVPEIGVIERKVLLQKANDAMVTQVRSRALLSGATEMGLVFKSQGAGTRPTYYSRHPFEKSSDSKPVKATKRGTKASKSSKSPPKRSKFTKRNN